MPKIGFYKSPNDSLTHMNLMHEEAGYDSACFDHNSVTFC
jgi:hypothetical protein